ncbi:PREDICTED: serine/threonine-protein kinase BLUS1 isoform X4 [Nelumbo nucifera]|uniref:Serine/threonine-protein kinase BLUS1 isoform X4 n=1 Tax=Nelumbo nucifera TaxID=4432 RepID=A0A1U7ZCG0_NELNU|nr:PREDICTED: serine/threonine-protein kinase BLUS1 isoform X4 [Nelumbo nucifera]
MEHIPEKRFPVNSNDYKLYEEVGEGVSATVYRALCIPFNEIVAIKVLDLEKCNSDLDSIRREVQTMSLIDHPNVLRAYCSFTADRSLWVVMPYMSGGSCLHIMKSAFPEGFEEPVIATLLREVLKALVYLHAHGLIHRDVKAGNILIDSNGAVKLGDFGVSACMFDTGDRQRSRNTFVGTPCWMAPEVMQQLHGYDFKADIWSFGITALELAHGHAPFSKYPPMKVLLMTLQNAPPGLDYERDKKFSKSFKEMVATCLVKDPKKRPTPEKLLKHSFFKHARSNDYLSRTILDGLSPLGDRFRMLKAKEADFLAQNKVMYGDKEQLSQREYIRGISAWNFNLEDLKAQAALIQDDGVPSEEDQDMNSKLNGCNVDLVPEQSPERVNNSNVAPAKDAVNDFKDMEDSLASFPIRPLQALKEFTQQKYQPERNYSGPLSYCHKKDMNNITSVEDASEGTVVQRKGRFKVTQADLSPKATPAKCLANQVSGGSTIPTSTIPAALVLPSLQYILQQNSMQREQIIKLIKCVEQTSGHHTEFADSGTSDLSQVSPTSARERELLSEVITLQQSIGNLVEELQKQKAANSQLEKQLNDLHVKQEVERTRKE